MSAPPDVKSRPPAGNRKGGPNARSVTITALRIAQGPVISAAIDTLPARMLIQPVLSAYDLADLSPRLASQIVADPETGCWFWTGRLDRDGYGRFRGRGTHRLVWLELVGPVPAGLVLDHREDWGCTSKACCWPRHLLPVTNSFNLNRGRITKTHCDNGHEFSVLNTYWRPGGQRDCRACIRARVAKYQAKLKSAGISRKQAVRDAAGLSDRRAA